MNQQPINPQSQADPGHAKRDYFDESPHTTLAEKPINWKKLIFILLSNWYWFIICLGIALAIAFFKVRYTILQYEASTSMIIEGDQASNDVLNEFRAIRYIRQRAEMTNEIAKLQSFKTIKRAIDSLDQEIFWTAHGRIRERPLYDNPRLDLVVDKNSADWFKDQNWFVEIISRKKFRLYQENGLDTILRYNNEVNIHGWGFTLSLASGDLPYNTYHFIVNTPSSLAQYYRNKLQIETIDKEGTIITMRSSGPVGGREVDFLNTLSSIYILAGLERKQEIATNTFSFIDDQISIILDSLNKVEDQLISFRLTNNVINLSREGEIAFDKIKSYHQQKTELKLKENYYNYLQSYVKERNDPKTLISPTLADAHDALLISAVNEMQQLYEEREKLDYSAHQDNPGLQSINMQIRATRIRILEIIDGLINNNKLILDQILIEEQSVLDQLKSLPLNEQQLLNIKRKYDLYNQFYTFLLQKRAEAGIQKASTISNVYVIDQAMYDQVTQIGSDKKVILLFAVLLGILLPGVVLFLKDLLDNKVRDREDITSKSSIPVIGIVGHSKYADKMPLIDAKNSAFAESLRTIRTNIQYFLRDPKDKVIMVTSSVSGEGKTFIAANLSAIFAMNNKRVLLVGCDLRRPSLHTVFEVDNKSGLSSVLIGDKTLEECTFETSIENLFLLPAGPIPPNPAELIETKEMIVFFKENVSQYDYVIFDTPPIALVSDSLVLSKYADTTLYVIRQNYSHKDVINIANQMWQEDRLPSLSLIINDIMPSSQFGYNYYYGYGRGYNYGYYNYGNGKDYYTKNPISQD